MLILAKGSKKGQKQFWKVARGGCGETQGGIRLWNVGGFRPQRQSLLEAKRGGETHQENLRRPRVETDQIIGREAEEKDKQSGGSRG